MTPLNQVTCQHWEKANLVPKTYHFNTETQRAEKQQYKPVGVYMGPVSFSPQAEIFKRLLHMTVSADRARYLLIALGRVSLKHFPAFGKSPAWLKRWGWDLQLLPDGPELRAVVPLLLLTSFMATSSWRSLNLHLAIWELLHSSTPTFVQLRDSMDSCSCWVLADEHQNHRRNAKKPNKESTIWKRRPILFQLRYKRTIFPSQVR